MHSSVLQNKKYIKFSNENTVEVIALGSLDRGIEAGDRKAATYAEKNEKGEELQFLVEFPGLTADDINALHRSPAGRYNTTGKIPYTALVDPHTLAEITHWSGGIGSGLIMDAVEEARKQLDKDHGKGPSRRSFNEIEEGALEIEELLAESDFSKALKIVDDLIDDHGEDHQALAEKVNVLQQRVMDKGTKRLDELASQLDGEDSKNAMKELKKLARAFKRTELEETINEVIEAQQTD
jgi:hypothetical protein